MNASDECVRLDVAVRTARRCASEAYLIGKAWREYLRALDLALDAVDLA